MKNERRERERTHAELGGAPLGRVARRVLQIEVADVKLGPREHERHGLKAECGGHGGLVDVRKQILPQGEERVWCRCC